MTDQPPKLLDQMRDHLRLRRYVRRTEEAYVNWARRFIHFRAKRWPHEMKARGEILVEQQLHALATII